MTHLEFHCSDEKATALLKAARIYDEGVEVEPVRHGRWVYGEDVDIQCSECGGDAMSDWMKYTQVYSNYCPHCGAKMDGGMKE